MTLIGKTALAHALLKEDNFIQPMMLQKTFHMSQPLDECRARLSNLPSYRRHLVRVTKATVTSSKTTDFRFRGPLGFEAHTVIASVETGSPEQFAFESWGGNIDLMGLVEFDEVRPGCTEVTLAVHYVIQNKLYAWLDRTFGFVDAFMTAELRSLRSHFEGVATPVAEPEPAYGMLEPLRA